MKKNELEMTNLVIQQGISDQLTHINEMKKIAKLKMMTS